MDKLILLCGFTGCGKTTLGEILAREINYQFADTDQMILAAEGKTRMQIFEEGGEVLFREKEFNAAKIAASLKRTVVATGGGLLTFSKNVDLLRPVGIIIYIEAPFEICYQRLCKEGRPLVASRSKEEMRRMYEERLPVYERISHMRVRAEENRMDTVEKMKKMIKKY